MEKELLANKHATTSSPRRLGLGQRSGLTQRTGLGARQGPGLGLEKGEKGEKGFGVRSSVNKRSSANPRIPPTKSTIPSSLSNRKKAWNDPTTQTAQRPGLGVSQNKGGRGGGLGGGTWGASGTNGVKSRASVSSRSTYPSKLAQGQGLGPGLASGSGRGQGQGKGTYAGGAAAYVHGQRARANMTNHNHTGEKGEGEEMTPSILRKSRTTGAIRLPLNHSPKQRMNKNMMGSSSVNGLNISLSSNHSSDNDDRHFGVGYLPGQGLGSGSVSGSGPASGLGPSVGVVRKGPGLVQGLRQRRGQVAEPMITLERIDSEAEYRAKAGLLPANSPR